MKNILFLTGGVGILAIGLFLVTLYFAPVLYPGYFSQINRTSLICPPIHKMKFGVEILKFLVWEEPGVEPRLHLIVPLDITGMSGKIVELREI